MSAAAIPCHDAAYVRQRVREEVARSSDMGYGFTLASVEATGPRVMAGRRAFGDAREAMRRTLRPSDVLNTQPIQGVKRWIGKKRKTAGDMIMTD